MKRRWVLWLLTVGLVWLIVAHRSEVRGLAQVLRQGIWYWLLAAVLLQVVYHLVLSELYRSSFDTLDVPSRTFDLLPIVVSSVFVNLVAPTGGASGAALFVDDASRRGQPAARVAAGALLEYVADLAAFLFLLAAGMGELLLHHDLTPIDAVASLILFLLTVTLATVLLLGLWRPAWLRRRLVDLEGWLRSSGRRFGRPDLVRAGWGETTADEFGGAGEAVRRHPLRLLRTLGIAFGAHLVDLATLGAVCLAFRQPVSPGVLLAAYAVGVLFWIVALTPQGVGIVEGAMTLVLARLGVPFHSATAIALVFRGAAFWLPLLAGFLVVRRIGSFRQPRRQEAGAWEVQAVAVMAAVMGLVNLLSAATPSLASRLAILRQVLPLEVRQGGHLAAALAGFGLILLAYNLSRRKRLGWVLAISLLVISAVSHLIKGLDYEEAGLALLLVLCLILLRHHFHARSDPPSARQALQVLAAALAFTLAYGTAGFYLLDRHYTVRFSLPAAIRQTVIMFTSFQDPGLEPITGFGRFFAGSIYVVAAATMGYALLLLLRPVLVRRPSSTAERERARRIVEGWGCSSLARLALLPDKSFLFSEGGSVVAYVAKGRAAVALGDPIGPPQDALPAITAFRDLCWQSDWNAAFYQTLPELLPAYQEAGFHALRIGAEAIVDLEHFSLEGKDGKAFRNAQHRLTRLGHRVGTFDPPIAPEVMEELRAVSDEWLTLVHGTEKRFSLGWFDGDYVASSQILAVLAADGAVTAFANLLPEYRRNETSVDLMRHRREAPPGTMDFLFLALFEWSKAHGFATFNLGLSSLSGVGEHPQDPGLERALHFSVEHIRRFYDFKGLFEYKAKFNPSWSPRFLIYPSAAALPSILACLARADSGDDGWLGILRR